MKNLTTRSIPTVSVEPGMVMGKAEGIEINVPVQAIHIIWDLFCEECGKYHPTADIVIFGVN